jgi:hypothetical protein
MFTYQYKLRKFFNSPKELGGSLSKKKISCEGTHLPATESRDEHFENTFISM